MKSTSSLAIVIFLLLICSNQYFACSINNFVPFKFNPNEYIFFGKIVGYSDKVETIIEQNNSKIPFTAYGVRVKVETIINLPQTTETIEVFRIYPRDTACTPSGQSLDEVKKAFPINTSVRIIGQEDKSLLGNSSNAIPKIEVTGQGQLFNNITKKGKVLTTIESEFDYKLSLPLFESKFTTDETFVWLFEIRKDLKRLEKVNSEDERYSILKRLAFAYDNYQDYGNLVEKYLQDKQKQKELFKIKKNWEKKKRS